MSQGGRHYIFATAQQERPTKPAELSPISSRRHLSLDPLHRAAANTHDPGDLQNAVAGSQVAGGSLSRPSDQPAADRAS